METATAPPNAHSRPAFQSHPRPGKGDHDRAIVDFIGRHGLVTMDHVIEGLGLGRATAYRRTAACVEADLLERFDFRHLAASLLRATRRGLRYAGLGLRPATVSFASVDHRLRCATVARLLAEEFSAEQVFTERELIQAERIDGAPIFSAPITDSRLHRPDLAVLTPEQRIAIELELTPKGPQRLHSILSAWAKATHIAEVRYYVEPGPTQRGLDRALSRLGFPSRIRLFEAPPR